MRDANHRAYSRLQSDLVECRLLPGVRVDVGHLTHELSVSEMTVRHALYRLVAEGLVTNEPNGAFVAAPIDWESFHQLAQACVDTETPCLRWVLARADLEWEASLCAQFHVASTLLARVGTGSEEIGAYIASRHSFDETLLAPCDNRWLLRSWQLLHAQYTRYRRALHTLRPGNGIEDELRPTFFRVRDAAIRRDGQAIARARFEEYACMAKFVERNIAPLANSSSTPTTKQRHKLRRQNRLLRAAENRPIEYPERTGQGTLSSLEMPLRR
jgi:GntR family carbon starvation induced transcriptional regulator